MIVTQKNKHYTKMKKTYLLLICLLVTRWLSAQESQDTTHLKFGDVKIIIIDGGENDSDTSRKKVKSKKTYNSWTGLELGINGLLTADGSTSLPKELNYMELDYSKSLVWNFNFADIQWDWFNADDDTEFRKTNLGIISGFGLTYRSFTFENNTQLFNVNDSTFGVEDTVLNYSKNKLRSSYLRVPLLLQFYSMRRKGSKLKPGFHIAAGVVGGLRLGTIYKRKYKENGKGEKSKQRDDFNLTPLVLDAELRIGYGHLNLFASYGLTQMFEDKKGPELYPVTMGVSLTKLF